MKLLRTPGHRQLLRMLTSARQRAALTQAELADKVTARRGFALKYACGERGPLDFGSLNVTQEGTIHRGTR